MSPFFPFLRINIMKEKADVKKKKKEKILFGFISSQRVCVCVRVCFPPIPPSCDTVPPVGCVSPWRSFADFWSGSALPAHLWRG